MKLLKTITLLLIINSTFAGIKFSKSDECTTYKLDNEIQRGAKGVGIISNKRAYGMFLDDMRIDFNNRNANFILKEAVILGFDREVITKRMHVSEENSNFQNLIDMYQQDRKSVV